MQGDTKPYDDYLNYRAWLENAAAWQRSFHTLRVRVLDGREPRNQDTFAKIVECHRRYRAAVATAIGFARA